MKKVLSLVLSLALIIATMALPISASAASIDLFGLGTGTVAISYKAFASDGTTSIDKIHVGDTIKVGAYITAPANTYTDIQVPVKYDPTVLRYNSTALSIETAFTSTQSDIITTDATNGIVNYNAVDLSAALTADETKMFTMEFEVIAVPEGNTSVITCVTNEYQPEVVNVDGDYYAAAETGEKGKVTTTPLTLTCEANTAKATVTYGSTSATEDLKDGGKYYDATNLTIKYVATNLESAKIEGTAPVVAEAPIPEAGYTISTAGTYKVTVTAKGGVTAVYAFTYYKEDISASLSSSVVAVTEKAYDGYRAKDQFKVPVTISLNESASAAMVKFDVKYDTASLTLDTTGTALVKYTELRDGDSTIGYTVTYGTDPSISADTTPLTNGNTVAELTFTVADGATLGDKLIAVSNATFALVTDEINPKDNTLGSPNDQTVTVVVEKFATATYATENQPWTNGEYYVTVAPYNGDSTITTGYMAYTDLTGVVTDSQDGLKAIYDAAAAQDPSQVTNSIKFNSEGKYYAVAKIGSVYQLIELPNNKIDKTAPTVDASAADMTKWASGVGTYSLNVSGVQASDEKSDVTLTYTLGSDTLTVVDGYITIPAGSYNGEVVTVTATDEAGNTQTDKINLMLDGVAPNVTVAIGEIKAADNSRDLTITVTGLGGGSSTSVALYKSDSAVSDIADVPSLTKVKDLDVTEGVAVTENVKTAGFYYVYAVDEAGNKSYGGGEVTFNKLNAASGITVKVLKSATDYIEGFKTTKEMTDIGITDKGNTTLDTNGSFTYVAIKVNAPITGYSNEITVKKGGSDTTLTPGTDGEYVFDAEGVYEFVVTTTNNGNSLDSKSATYKFSVVEAAAMPSINADMRYSVIDYAMIRKLTTASKLLPAAGDDYWGGLFSGDLTGDLKVTNLDLAAMLTSLRNGEKKGAYNSIPVMNYEAPSTGE